MASKRKVRKSNARVAAAKKTASAAASKLNIKKDVASAVKGTTTYQKDWKHHDAKGRMGGQSKSIKGRNKAEYKLEKNLDRQYGMKQNQEGWNPYEIGGKERYMNQKRNSFYGNRHQMDKSQKKLDKIKRQAGLNSRDIPLPPTSDKYFK